MNVKNEIKSILAASGLTLSEVVDRLNKEFYIEKPTSVQNLSNKLARGSLRYDEAQQIAHVIGKQIEWNDIKD